MKKVLNFLTNISEETMKTNKLFVYGTLSTYEPFLSLLNKGEIVRIGKGKIEARRVKAKYPAAVEDNKSFVSGEIFEIKNPEKILPIFDKYEEFDWKNRERSLYIRKVKRAVQDDKKKTYVFVYLYNQNPRT
jgi:gamma-glutamylcyclotransferase (GGCT)/AIG2-like uncharacterized protein YtfP